MSALHVWISDNSNSSSGEGLDEGGVIIDSEVKSTSRSSEGHNARLCARRDCWGHSGSNSGLSDSDSKHLALGLSNSGKSSNPQVTKGILNGNGEVSGSALQETCEGRTRHNTVRGTHGSSGNSVLLERRCSVGSKRDIGCDLQRTSKLWRVSKVNDRRRSKWDLKISGRLSISVGLTTRQQASGVRHSRARQSGGQGSTGKLVSKDISTSELTSSRNTSDRVCADERNGHWIKGTSINGDRVSLQVHSIDGNGDVVSSGNRCTHTKNVLPTDVSRGIQDWLNENSSGAWSNSSSSDQDGVGWVINGLVAKLIIRVDLVVSKEVPVAQTSIGADLGQGRDNLSCRRQSRRWLHCEVHSVHRLESITSIHHDVNSVQNLLSGILVHVG